MEQNNPDYQLVVFAMGVNANFYTPVERIETIQSVLFYSDKNIANGERFYQTFSMDQTTLKYHVIRGAIILYVDKNNSHKYFFESINK